MRIYRFRHMIWMTALFAIYAAETHGDATEEFGGVYHMEPGAGVQVHNMNGNVEITAWNESYADVRAVKRTKENRSELDKVKIAVSEEDGLDVMTVIVRKKSEGNSFISGIIGGMGRGPKVSVEYTIKVPQSALLREIETVNGSVVLRGTRGDAAVHTVNGTVTVTDGAHVLEASTTNGDVVISGGTVTGSASTTNGSITAALDAKGRSAGFSTVNGSISLSVPKGLNADVELRTVNGRVSVPEGLALKAGRISPRHIMGRLGSGGKTISAETVNGSISLNVK